jgi:hypothetical protein
MIECTEGHYEVQKTSFGEAYVWCPACVVVECDCGERAVLSASETVCSCGADHATLVREELASRRSPEEVPHPWEAEYQEWRKKHDELLRSEGNYWLEWKLIE